MISQRRIKTLIEHGKRVSTLSKYRFKLGAVIFKGKKIIATGFNKNKTHPKAGQYYKHGSVHAEIDAILHATENVSGTSMLVYRSLASGQPAIAKPCAMCTQVMHEFGIKEVFWTVSGIPFWDHAFVEDLYNLINKEEAFELNNYIG